MPFSIISCEYVFSSTPCAFQILRINARSILESLDVPPHVMVAFRKRLKEACRVDCNRPDNVRYKKMMTKETVFVYRVFD